VKWVEVVEAVVEEPVVVAAAAQAGAAVVGRAGWAAGLPPGRAAIVSAPTAGTGSRTRWVCPATRKSVPNAAQR